MVPYGVVAAILVYVSRVQQQPPPHARGDERLVRPAELPDGAGESDDNGDDEPVVDPLAEEAQQPRAPFPSGCTWKEEENGSSHTEWPPIPGNMRRTSTSCSLCGNLVQAWIFTFMSGNVVAMNLPHTSFFTPTWKEDATTLKEE